ncbi:ATP-binding protein [Candidatus Albibeggiatoa sp. nov. NOAA]|uniref:Dph6-related ATP pyrophosphatase n=1 Tax=Candidatus Albibeggiatoa sp. nov. NOAA TaxID=3162724 RepID=UPI0032F40171|nr:adenine nucleotide alpha hydrolase [Thiotrichaceae bacterium]
MSWSSGKDSAWALYQLLHNPEFEVVGLFCTINKKFNRVAMHSVRVALLKQQAAQIGLPLHIIELPFPCSNVDYEAIMGDFVAQVQRDEIDCFAFGDLFLEDIRQYREDKLQGTGIEPIFPIWGMPTDELSYQMIDVGLKAITTCVDPKQAPEHLIGQIFDKQFLQSLPDGVDPCGENGEFHSFVFDAPMFKQPIDITVGEIVHRDGFIFADVLPTAATTQ